MEDSDIAKRPKREILFLCTGYFFTAIRGD
jgi:hypothetical protein